MNLFRKHSVAILPLSAYLFFGIAGVTPLAIAQNSDESESLSVVMSQSTPQNAADHFEQLLLELENTVIEFDKALRRFSRSAVVVHMEHLDAFIRKATKLVNRSETFAGSETVTKWVDEMVPDGVSETYDYDRLQYVQRYRRTGRRVQQHVEQAVFKPIMLPRANSYWAFELLAELNREEEFPMNSDQNLENLQNVQTLQTLIGGLATISNLKSDEPNPEISVGGWSLQVFGSNGSKWEGFVDFLQNKKIQDLIKNRKNAGKLQVNSFSSVVWHLKKLTELTARYEDKSHAINKLIESNAEVTDGSGFPSSNYISSMRSGLLRIANGRTQPQFLTPSGRRALKNLQGLDQSGFLEVLTPDYLEVLTDGLAPKRELFWMTTSNMVRFYFEIYDPVFQLLKEYSLGDIVPRTLNPNPDPKVEVNRWPVSQDQEREIRRQWKQARDNFDASAYRLNELRQKAPHLTDGEFKERMLLEDERMRYLDSVEAELLKDIYVSLEDGGRRPAKRLTDFDYLLFYIKETKVEQPKYIENSVGLALEKIDNTVKESQEAERVWSGLRANPIEMAMLLVGKINRRDLTSVERTIVGQILDLLDANGDLPSDHKTLEANAVNDYMGALKVASRFETREAMKTPRRPRNQGGQSCKATLASRR